MSILNLLLKTNFGGEMGEIDGCKYLTNPAIIAQIRTLNKKKEGLVETH